MPTLRSTFFLIWLLPLNLFAQPKGFHQIKDAVAFRKSLSAANASVQTITSDFAQVKNMALLAEKIKSKGKFSFKKEDKVRIEYTSPYSYLMIMNGGRLLVKDEQKTSRINTRNSKAMQSANRVMVDCMRGTIFSNTDFKTQAWENDSQYLLELTPVDANMAKMFRMISVYMDKRTFDVARLLMTEQNNDFTQMDFTNTKHNTPLDEQFFKVN